MDPSQTTIVSGCADTLQQEPRMRTCVVGRATNNIGANLENVTDETGGFEIKETVIVSPETNVKHSEAELICCTLDMCNYRDSNELSVIIDQSPDRKGNYTNQSKSRTSAYDIFLHLITTCSDRGFIFNTQNILSSQTL